MKFDGYLFVVFLALFHITFCSKVFETKIDRLNQHHETDDGLAREKRVEQDVEEQDARALTKRNGRYALHFLIVIFYNSLLKILKKSILPPYCYCFRI